MKTYWLTDKTENALAKMVISTVGGEIEEKDPTPPAVVVTNDTGQEKNFEVKSASRYTPITLDTIKGSELTKAPKETDTLRDSLKKGVTSGIAVVSANGEQKGNKSSETKAGTKSGTKKVKSQACRIL